MEEIEGAKTNGEGQETGGDADDFGWAPDENQAKNAQAPKKRELWYLPIHILAFAVPFALMAFAFSTTKIFPFGKEANRQIMVVDSWHQYYPFLQELHHKLQNGESLLYSWNTGAGTNFLALMAYYASTPIYLLSVLFPQEYLREFMMFATIAKIACSGLFFSIYLRGVHSHCFREQTESKKYCSPSNGFAIIGFSALYALSAYAAGYYWCIMWLDCMALLPLVVLGLERLIDSGKYKLYIVALGLTVICDYYIAIFVCEFIALYYFVLYFAKTKKPTLKGFCSTTAKAVGASAVGVGLSMFILLPTFLWFGNTGNSGSSFAREVTTYNTLLDIVTNLLPNTTPNQRAMAGLPNIACGLATVIFAGLYFLNSKIRTREKLFVGGFLLFMLFSFNMNILDYYWHGLHFPNEIPYRQAFVFSFVLVAIAYRSYASFEGESLGKGAVWKLCLAVFGYLVFAEQWYKSSDKFDFKVFYFAIAMLLAYMALALLRKNNKLPKSYFAAILMLAMIFEGGISAVRGAAVNAPSDRDSYAPSKENIQKTIKEIYEKDDDLFFRLEMSRWFTTNDPALYGYRGISQFSSEANSRFARTLEVLGIAATIPSNRFLYSSATPVFNSLMSIKYLMARDSSEYSVDSVAFSEFARNATLDENEIESNAVVAYKNKYWLPLGFVVSEDIGEVKLVNEKYSEKDDKFTYAIHEPNIFATQNEIMKKATGITGNVFSNIHQASNSNDNLTESSSSYGSYTYTIQDKSKKGTVNHVYTSEKTQQVYIYLKSARSSKKDYNVVRANGAKKEYEINRGITIDCGTVPAGQDISVSFEVDAGDGGSFNLYVAGFDEEAFRQGYDILNNGALSISEFGDTNIKGTVTAASDGIFFTSIPYDKGWKLKIDGKKVETNPQTAAEANDVAGEAENPKSKAKPDQRQIKKITDGFVTAPITEGEHEIELYYITEGLVPGMAVSILCALIVAGLALWEMHSKKRAKTNQ